MLYYFRLENCFMWCVYRPSVSEKEKVKSRGQQQTKPTIAQLWAQKSAEVWLIHCFHLDVVNLKCI